MPSTGDYFGGKAVELAGIIIHPRLQGQGIGTQLVNEYVDSAPAHTMISYTRNPSILRVLEEVSNTDDIINYPNAEQIADIIPHAEVTPDGYIYHLDRYAPNGLYGTYDPADRKYKGRVLKERCEELQNPNNALALAVDLRGGSHE